MALVVEHPLRRDFKPVLRGVRAQRRGLRADRLVLLLPGRGHPGVDRRAGHGVAFLPGRPADPGLARWDQDGVGHRQIRGRMTVEDELRLHRRPFTCLDGLCALAEMNSGSAGRPPRRS